MNMLNVFYFVGQQVVQLAKRSFILDGQKFDSKYNITDIGSHLIVISLYLISGNKFESSKMKLALVNLAQSIRCGNV